MNSTGNVDKASLPSQAAELKADAAAKSVAVRELFEEVIECKVEGAIVAKNESEECSEVEEQSAKALQLKQQLLDATEDEDDDALCRKHLDEELPDEASFIEDLRSAERKARSLETFSVAGEPKSPMSSSPRSGDFIIRNRSGREMSKRHIVRCMRAYNEAFGENLPDVPSLDLETQCVVAAITAYEHYEEEIHDVVYGADRAVPPQDLEDMHLYVAGAARNLFFGILRGYEYQEPVEEFRQKLVMKINNSYITHKHRNDNRKKLQELRTAFFFLVLGEMTYFAFRGFAALGIHSITSLCAVLVILVTVTLISWICVRISGQHQEFGDIIDDCANAVFDTIGQFLGWRC